LKKNLDNKDILAFLDTWAHFDPGATLWIKTYHFPDFLLQLPIPMGFSGMRRDELLKPSELAKIIYSLNVRDYSGQVYFPEVMWAVFYSVVGFSNDKLHKEKSNKKLLKKIKNKYKRLNATMTMDDLCGNSFYRN
jgi:hypothetical protein